MPDENDKTDRPEGARQPPPGSSSAGNPEETTRISAEPLFPAADPDGTRTANSAAPDDESSTTERDATKNPAGTGDAAGSGDRTETGTSAGRGAHPWEEGGESTQVIGSVVPAAPEDAGGSPENPDSWSTQAGSATTGSVGGSAHEPLTQPGLRPVESTSQFAAAGRPDEPTQAQWQQPPHWQQSTQWQRTQEQPTPGAAPGGPGSPPPRDPFGGGGARDPFGNGGGSGRQRRGFLRGGIVAACVVAALAVLYGVDLLTSSGEVPRGTLVAGVDVGGMNKKAAANKLRTQLGPNLNGPVQLQAGPARTALDPQAAGLKMDWPATVERAGEQPLNPFTRLTSLFTSHKVQVATHGDREQLTSALQRALPRLEQAPVEGNIRFNGATPVAVDPKPGRKVNMSTAPDVVLDTWAQRGPVRLPVVNQPVSTSKAGVQKALNGFAKPATSAPVTITGDGKNATLSPEAIAGALRFEPDGSGGLKSSVDTKAAIEAARPQLADTERPGKDATFVLAGGRPTVQPSADGRGIDWERSMGPLRDVLLKQGAQQRTLRAAYVPQPPKLTTEQANGLGIVEPIGEFTTTGFKPDSGVNIRRVAEQINGAVIQPNQTFSLNGHTGPRGEAQGYIPAGVIENGKPAKDVGGGISQFATTLYNASYFGAMKNVEHKEHSYYISRYPMAREATVFQGHDGSSIIDVKFKNTSDKGVMLQTEWTPNSITVRLWGTKRFDVQSETGPPENPKPPQEVHQPAGPDCHNTQGKPGFTATDTRVLRDLRTGEVTKEPRKVHYNPQPKIICDAPAPPPPG